MATPTRNIFVLGMTEMQRAELETVRRADSLAFRGLLSHEELVRETDYDLDDLLDRARAELDAFDGTVDAVICHWDFPSSIMGPILSAERGLAAPSLGSLLRCEHKYWSRLEQAASVPEVVPGFSSFDPFAEDVEAQIALDFPYWVKPVKAHSSELGFAVHDADELAEAVRQIREEIEAVGDAFDQALARVDLPEELTGAGGTSCLAEQVVSGIQAAPEGTVYQGVFRAHGVFDMLKDEHGTSIARLDYPASQVPAEVQDRMVETSRRFLQHVGFDNGACNVEFMWEPDTDRLWLIEVNTRISQSHSDLFAKVDGASNHEVVIDIALGEEPAMPRGEGPYAVAAKCAIFHDEDALVTRVPTDEDVAAVQERYPGTRLTLQAVEGRRLSELSHQDSYRYLLGDLYLGATSHDEVQEVYEEVLRMLPFEFAPDAAAEPA